MVGCFEVVAFLCGRYNNCQGSMVRYSSDILWNGCNFVYGIELEYDTGINTCKIGSKFPIQYTKLCISLLYHTHIEGHHTGVMGSIPGTNTTRIPQNVLKEVHECRKTVSYMLHDVIHVKSSPVRFTRHTFQAHTDMACQSHWQVADRIKSCYKLVLY